jgi:hypothetical protein
MNTVMVLLKKWWPALLPAFLAAWHSAAPQIQNFVTTHPKAATWFGILSIFGATLLKSPLMQAEEALLAKGAAKIGPVLLLALLLPFGAKAQTNVAPSITPQYFVISVSAAGYGGQKAVQPVTIVGTAVQLTTNLSVGYNQIFNPNDSTAPKYNLGVVNYTRQLAEICSFCKSHFVFDTTQVLITGQAGLGRVSMTLPGETVSTSHIAEIVGAFINYPLANHVSMQLLGLQYLHGQGNTTLTRSNTYQISAGPYFTF